MDPSIMKLLEEDEDETMHSGADVEAFTAALNRDIEGDTSVISHPSDSDTAALSQGSNHNSGQLFPQWQTSSQNENASCQIQQVVNVAQQEQHASIKELNQHGSASENQLQQQIDSSKELNSIPVQPKQSQDSFPQQQTEQTNPHVSQSLGIQNSERSAAVGQEPNRAQDPSSISQYLRSQKMNSQQAAATSQANNASKNGKQVPFAMLFPVIEPLLDKDKAMQLRTIYNRLKKNEISKDAFVKHMRSLVGDHMLKLAVVKLQEQAPRSSQAQVVPTQVAPHSQGLNSSVNPSGPSSAVRALTDSSNMAMDNNSHILHDIKQERERPIPIQGLNKQQQQHMHFSQSSFPSYGTTGSNYSQYAGGNMHSPRHSLKQQPQYMQARQVPIHPGVGTMQSIGVPKHEKQNTFTEPMRVQGHYVKQEPVDQASEQQQKSQLSSSQGVSSFSPAQFEQANASGKLSNDSIGMQQTRTGFSTSTGIMQSNAGLSTITTQMDSSNSLGSRVSSTTPSVGPGSIAKPPMKKAIIGVKKPLESPASEHSQPMKKQKVFHSDQSIEQLNDVTAVSGVNLREEEEQLFSGPKEDSRVSEASRRVVQEEEDRLFLQKVPLQKKMTEIMKKWGLKSMSNDVERCLSLSAEERLRALISNLVRLSKQRVGVEKARHRTIVTSDVRQQIIAMNLKAREEWDKTQGDPEKSLNDPEGINGTEGDKEKDDTRARPAKVNKEDDDKMRTTAANVAARAAVGGDDMLSKWQLMAEARQKREGGVVSASSSQPSKEVTRKLVSTPVRNAGDNQVGEKRSQLATVATSGATRKSGKTQAMSQTGVLRKISVKDVIAALEREPHTSKSSLIYRSYEKH
ncbi:transcription initiation factor TFIID subunit 4b [Heracleum sosnowskyi]|uniref:Transcription initiation factor TFIID subunit 4b n=1 Tax=Heracleum sosnowskyi TaxID=360622 RepID=A0AAD8N176_9APIA|nr:transcription initiation factor TFIID subunit 4b [Heracleum sosnowskyi]